MAGQASPLTVDHATGDHTGDHAGVVDAGDAVVDAAGGGVSVRWLVQQVLIEAINQMREYRVTVAVACDRVGMPSSTYYRLDRGYQHYTPVADPVPQRDRVQPAALTAAETARIERWLLDPELAELSVQQVYWRMVDASPDWVCSQRTFYRYATQLDLVGDRRDQRIRPARPIPVLEATQPGIAWSWDATELKGGPTGRERYKLIVAIDIFSRFPVGWRIETTEYHEFAIDMFAAAFAAHGVPQVVHADNGSVMRCHELRGCLATAGAAQSFSRVRVSNDNPYSESFFKTIKYDYDFPGRFDNIDHARDWAAAFFEHYAHQHHHSGLAFHTPANVHDGTWTTVQAQRDAKKARYQAEHPDRFHGTPAKPMTVGPAGINNNTNKHLKAA